MPVGEAMHMQGADGARRAKRWLDSTTRVESSWTNEDQVTAGRLEFAWPYGGQTFSFDVGGVMQGGEYEKQLFVAEVKKYNTPGDQGTLYDDWLAKCYVTRRDHVRLASQFMWITWHPFRVTDWADLTKPLSIAKGLLADKNRKRIFNTDEDAVANKLIDVNIINDVAGRLWIVVLSDKQESLVISPDDRALIVAQRIKEASLT